MISLTLPIAPVAWQRVNRGAYGQAYVPNETRAFKRQAAVLARRSYSGPPLDVPLRLAVRFVLKPPKRVRWKLPAVKPDLDNFLKSVKDALEGVVWVNDSRLCEITMCKVYDWTGQGPRIELTVTEMAIPVLHRTEKVAHE